MRLVSYWLSISIKTDGRKQREHFSRAAVRLVFQLPSNDLAPGGGGHVWLFFEEAITAVSARRLGSFILTETMDRHTSISFGSYDRLFPNQDTLPKGGFGNLIALPLQKQPRDLGNSVFVDDNVIPHVDQWAFCSRFRGFLEFKLRHSCGKPSVVDA